MAEEGEGEVAGADQRGRTVRLLTRTVRHRSPMRACARCACTRLAAADLALPVRQKLDQEAETSRRLNMHRRTLQRILSRNANFKFNGGVQD